jgi:epoxyqueuosine reductase
MTTQENSKHNDDSVSESRRSFIKLGVAGAGLAAAAAGGVTIVKKMEGIPLEEFPLPMNEEFKPIDQRNQINTFSFSKKLNDAHPERIEKFDNFQFYEVKGGFMKGPYRDVPGQTQIDRALAIAGFSSPSAFLANKVTGMDSLDSGVASWEQTFLAKTKYTFENPEEAATCIKSAARMYGAVRCGITRQDSRWDYQPLYDASIESTLSWEKDFPFKPKTVVVIMVDMDYDAMATAPAWITDATVGDGYGNAIKIAGQLAVFLRQLGYQAVASMNDLGVNAPYAVAAGLGEAARNGQIITPHFGPRVRIAKVYTDFDAVEYDKPRDFGVASFCENCKRCAVSCPSQAITHGDPTWAPSYSSDPDYIWNAAPGIHKFHNDAKKCYRFWIENDGSCANCICACPYNKPNFWHHRLVDAQNVIAPGPVHSFMREMDILFGYGKVSDPDRVKRFWETGKKV